MRFEEAHDGWHEGRLTQNETRLLVVCERTFRSYLARHEADGLIDKISRRRAPVNDNDEAGQQLPKPAPINAALVRRFNFLMKIHIEFQLTEGNDPHCPGICKADTGGFSAALR